MAMAEVLRHRGPDDGGVWTDPAVGLALAHRRLAILDLSPEGHQPMVSACGRWVLVFNGEIYNFQVLRAELEQLGQRPWRGHSDTEVMLAAFAQWGIEASLRRFVGMFAFALWDRRERTLTLARDRLGEKPLYYGWMGRRLLFGSELKALRAHPSFHGEIDRNALALLMRHSYIGAPHSIYQGIHKLPPGTFLTLTAKGIQAATPLPYWSARQVAEQGAHDPFRGSDQEAVVELERILLEAVRSQMIADVPLGAFLSGGIDSSTVVALMQAQSSRPVQTFSIGFWEPAFNEAEHARAVARHLGTQHTELYVTPEEALAVIPRLPTLYDEPYADSSQIPTFLVAALARQQVTVSLSGDAGDELFCGYNRYFWATALWRRLGWAPPSLRSILAGGLTALAPTTWNALLGHLDALLPQDLHYSNPGDKLHKLAAILDAPGPEQIYRGLVSFWQDTGQLIPNSHEPTTQLNEPTTWPNSMEFEQRMMYLDMVTYLPDDILVKLDRAAMGVGLESRVPLLDHRVVEFAWRLPLAMKLRDGKGKWILRQVLYRHLPRELVERPKMGFGIPLADWLRGPLRDWAEALLDPRRLHREGWLDPRPVRTLWQEHLEGRRNWSYHLWNVLVFQEWLEARTL
jgi:asparagine synthase (glutamine-hydrolysing)